MAIDDDEPIVTHMVHIYRAVFRTHVHVVQLNNSLSTLILKTNARVDESKIQNKDSKNNDILRKKILFLF